METIKIKQYDSKLSALVDLFERITDSECAYLTIDAKNQTLRLSDSKDSKDSKDSLDRVSYALGLAESIFDMLIPMPETEETKMLCRSISERVDKL